MKSKVLINRVRGWSTLLHHHIIKKKMLRKYVHMLKYLKERKE